VAIIIDFKCSYIPPLSTFIRPERLDKNRASDHISSTAIYLQQSCQRVLPEIDQDSVIRKIKSFLGMLILLLKLVG